MSPNVNLTHCTG